MKKKSSTKDQRGVLTRVLFFCLTTSVVCLFASVSSIYLLNDSASTITDFLGIEVEEDFDRNVTELITSKGYPVEEHSVQTQDGYILSIQRIPHGRGEKATSKRKTKEVILMVHGMQCASDVFVLNEPEGSLGFVLPDAGYDVWLANTRGNRYSKQHVKYSPQMKEFWDFSFDEMAAHDLPTIIDYILKVTGQEQLNFIGNSQGSTVGFALLSEKSEYNKKIKLNIAISPAIDWSKASRFSTFIFQTLRRLVDMFGTYEFRGSDSMKLPIRVGCNSMLRFLCAEVFYSLGRSHMMNESRIGVYLSHFPVGLSWRSGAHFGQLIESKTFSKYDYGKEKNLVLYGQATPPEYDLSRVTAPTAVLWSATDQQTTQSNIITLRKKLPSLVRDYEVPHKFFTHLDFILGLEAKELVFDEILRILKTKQK